MLGWYREYKGCIGGVKGGYRASSVCIEGVFFLFRVVVLQPLYGAVLLLHLMLKHTHENMQALAFIIKFK